MTLAELNSIDFKKLATAPKPVRISVIFIGCVILAGLGYYFDTRSQIEALDQVKEKETELRQQFEAKQHKAANLELYKQQLEEMRRTFGAMLRQLPSKTEIPNLIVDISQMGLANGLEIELFKPQDEIKQEFYAEKPIQLKVKGSYHEFGKFASGIASLPRIVTLHDIALTPGVLTSDASSPAENPVEMTMTATVKTYRYLDEDNL